MKNLKILLPLNLLLIITFLYSFYTVKNNIIKTNYNLNTTEITGIITNIKTTIDKITITLKGKEKIIVNYYINNEKNDFELGDYIEVKGKINKPVSNTNFHLFNYQNYLKSQKIYWTFTADKISLISKNNNTLYKLKNDIINRIDSISKSKEYLYTFILGNTNYLEEDIKESYQYNGVSHLLAISGMHITLLLTILFSVLNKNKKINLIIVTIILLIYSFLANSTPSILRSIFLFTGISINKIFNLKLKNNQILLIIVCLFLLYNPYYIYNIGFLFSFLISYFLIIYSDIINNYKNYFIKIFITSLISFLVSIPIMINNFFQINLLSPIINMIIVPLVSVLVFPLSLVTLFLPFLDNILYLLIILLENISLFFSKISFFTLTLSHINIYFIILYYLLIIIILNKLKNKQYKYLLLIFIVLLIHNNYLCFYPFNSVHFLDVKQGDSAIISLKYNKANILIDTGGIINYNNSNSYSLCDNVLIPYLKSNGIKKLDYLVLTHGDYDHMGEAINLVNNFKVEKVIFNCGEFNELEKELIKVLNKKKIPYYSCIKELNIDKNKLYFLNHKDYGNENDNSSVVYTEFNNHKFLFMGDAGVEVEEDLIERYNLQDIDVLKVGHHGSKTSSSKNFINNISPKYSVISVGKNNRYGHPNDSVLDNLQDSKVYRTDQYGSIMFKINNDRLKIETCIP